MTTADKCNITCNANGVREGNEQCDGLDVGDETCQKRGFFQCGTVTCNADCTLNTSACGYNDCATNATRCLFDGVTLQSCGDNGSGCPVWGGDTPCANGCQSGACVAVPTGTRTNTPTATPTTTVGPRRQIVSLAIDPTTPARVYAGGLGGMFKSTDGGASWAQLSISCPEIGVVAIDPITPTDVYAIGCYSVFKSTDGGGSWTSLFGVSGQGAMAIDPMNPMTLYAGISYGVFKSTDGGGSWNLTTPPVPPYTIDGGLTHRMEQGVSTRARMVGEVGTSLARTCRGTFLAATTCMALRLLPLFRSLSMRGRAAVLAQWDICTRARMAGGVGIHRTSQRAPPLWRLTPRRRRLFIQWVVRRLVTG